MRDQPHSADRRPLPWLLTFFALLSVAGLIAMPILAGPPDGDQMPDIVRFIGHFHPLVLHLPIGVFALIVLQEMGAIFGRRQHAQVAHTAMFPLFFGAASAIIAVIAGFLLYQGSDDYEGIALAERHMWGGVIFAAGAVLTFVLKAWTVALDGNPAFYRTLLFTSVGVMGFTSHDGGSMTHGSNFLTQYAPDPIRAVLGLEKKGGDKAVPAVKAATDKAAAAPADPALGPVAKDAEPAASAVKVVYPAEPVFDHFIAPILGRRCVQCHKETKSKGKFRMDSYELLVKGGKEGPGLEAGNTAESNILVRIHLPEDDDERMPPEGKSQIEPHEIAVLEWWIGQGADPLKTLNDYDVPAEIHEAVGKLETSKSPSGPVAAGAADPDDDEPLVGPELAGPETAEAAPADGPNDALKAAVADISKEFPGALSFESQKSSALTFTAVSLRGEMNDEGFAKLQPVLPQLVTLDLSATTVTDKSVALLAASKDLRLVRLAETGITDAAIDTLIQLPALQSINLYGTAVTDAGIAKLAALPGLKHLYLWKAAVTPAGIAALQEKLPDCEIVTGIEE